MSKLEMLFSEYSQSHQNHTNQLIHWIFVPLIFISAIGMLWDVKLGIELSFLDGEMLNAAMVASLFIYAYYFALSFSISLGILIVIVSGLIACHAYNGPISIWMISLVVFVISWIFQFVGHKIEGKKPSFFKDIEFFLVGPMWVLAKLYNKLGIKY